MRIREPRLVLAEYPSTSDTSLQPGPGAAGRGFGVRQHEVCPEVHRARQGVRRDVLPVFRDTLLDFQLSDALVDVPKDRAIPVRRVAAVECLGVACLFDSADEAVFLNPNGATVAVVVLVVDLLLVLHVLLHFLHVRLQNLCVFAPCSLVLVVHVTHVLLVRVAGNLSRDTVVIHHGLPGAASLPEGLHWVPRLLVGESEVKGRHPDHDHLVCAVREPHRHQWHAGPPEDRAVLGRHPDDGAGEVELDDQKVPVVDILVCHDGR
mmetsp:Transcript_100404/g.321992  ORF Transcript_100404/g.321992 Transcript_100404/m.321992 type:complete len:264 (-) Transcript_100404:4475-5266(-)